MLILFCVPICMHFRLGHHSTSDESSQYRGVGESEVWTSNGVNGIDRTRRYLELKGLWSQEMDDELKKEARSYILKKIKEHEKITAMDVLPGIFDDVFDKSHLLLNEQRRELKEHLERYKDKYNFEKVSGIGD